MTKQQGFSDHKSQLHRYYRDQEEDVLRMYHDSHRWHKQRRRLDVIRRYLVDVDLKGRSILDVGCGDGFAASYVFEGVQYGSYTGIDLAPVKLAAVKSRVARALPILGDAEVLPFDRATFDCVFCFEVLEHLLCPEVALKEIHRVLAPHGMFIFSTPVDSPLQRLWNNLRSRLPFPRVSDFHEHVQLFTYRDAKDLLESHGFTFEKEELCVFAFPLDGCLSSLPYEFYAKLDPWLCRIAVERFGVGLSPISKRGIAFGREYLAALVRKSAS